MEYYVLEEVSCYICPCCHEVYRIKERAQECIVKHTMADYRAILWENGRSLRFICFKANWNLSIEMQEIAQKISKETEISIIPPSEFKSYKIHYNPFTHCFDYGGCVSIGINRAIECIRKQKVII